MVSGSQGPAGAEAFRAGGWAGGRAGGLHVAGAVRGKDRGLCQESVHAGAGRRAGRAECGFGVERAAGQLHPGQG